MQQRLAKIVIPDDVTIADLKLRRDPDGNVSFDWAAIQRICAASGLDVAALRDGPEDNVAALIVQWYGQHRARGGELDPGMEDLIAEVGIEDAHGQSVSLEPGRA